MRKPEITSAKLPAVVYAINQRDELVEVDEQWSQFANANDAGISLKPENVIGLSLWRFIREPALQAIYKQVIEKVRKTGQSVAFPFRCDSPRFRRYMRMRIEPMSDQSIRFTSETVDVVERTEGVRAAAAFSGVKPVRRCSICNRYQLDSEWTDIATVLEKQEVLDHDHMPQVIWAVCTDCRARITRA